MTISLQLRNGDMQMGLGNSLATVRGSQKVVQDLNVLLLTELGSNRFTPEIGSTITMEPGDVIQLGDETISVSEDKLDNVLSEINRIVAYYQRNQLARIRQEIINFDGRHTFDEGEIITNYAVEYEDLATTLYVTVRLSMLSGVETTLGLEI